MGYTTEFSGEISITPPLNEAEISYLKDFSSTRRMHRARGPFFVKGTGYAGQDHEPDIYDYNREDPTQPGLWCQWVASFDGSSIIWNGAEKFYGATEWMQYLIDNFFKPGAIAQVSSVDERFSQFTFDHIFNGEIEAEGEESGDLWKLVVTNNLVKRKQAIVTYED